MLFSSAGSADSIFALSYCGHGRGNRARDIWAVGFGVLATARHTQVWLRVEVHPNPPRPKSFRPAAAPTVTAHGIFEYARQSVSSLFARSRSAFRLSRAIRWRIEAHCGVACAFASLRRVAPCPACASPRLARPDPTRVAKLAHRSSPACLARAASSNRATCPPRLPNRLLATVSSLLGATGWRRGVFRSVMERSRNRAVKTRFAQGLAAIVRLCKPSCVGPGANRCRTPKVSRIAGLYPRRQ